MKNLSLALFIAVVLSSTVTLRAEYLYSAFLTPSFDGQPNTEYNAWDVFYSANGLNYPDVSAPNGILQTRSAAGFPANTSAYNPADPLAFWNINNATLSQTAGGAFIVGPGTTGNIYSFSTPLRIEIADNTPYVAETVAFQFQTEGTLSDFYNIRLIYNDGVADIALAAADYLREYQASGSSFGGYGNRSALQWDLRGLNISSYKIVLTATGSSMSFQRALLDTASSYASVVPAGHTWNAPGTGTWSDGANWLEGSTSITNGNVKFANSAAALIQLDGDRTIGELIFQSANDATINPEADAALTANTGITTTDTASGVYTINSAWKMDSFNVFDLQAGQVAINGVVSGSHGLLKTGDGQLSLNANNTFTGGVGVEGGILRLAGLNAYNGTTTTLFGTIVVAADALSGVNSALGNATSSVIVGASNTIFSDIGNPAQMLIEGDHVVGRSVSLAQGPFEKRLGAFGTTAGAVFSGTVDFGSAAASNVHFSAALATDRVTFTGAIIGGATNATLIKDGFGTVIYSGAIKTYSNATTVSSGTLQIESNFTGDGNLTVSAGARLVVNGTLAGSGNLSLNGGSLEGNGTVNRAFAVGTGTTLAPGNSVGTLSTVTQSWAGGGTYLWDISDATGVAGSGWDLLSIDGVLNLTSNAIDTFTIGIHSLTLGHLAGITDNFDASTSYSWKFATTTGGINGLSSGIFAIDTCGFQNLVNGDFTIAQNGNDLFMVYTAIPEPSSTALLGFGIFILTKRKRCNAALKNTGRSVARTSLS